MSFGIKSRLSSPVRSTLCRKRSGGGEWPPCPLSAVSMKDTELTNVCDVVLVFVRSPSSPMTLIKILRSHWCVLVCQKDCGKPDCHETCWKGVAGGRGRTSQCWSEVSFRCLLVFHETEAFPSSILTLHLSLFGCSSQTLFRLLFFLSHTGVTVLHFGVFSVTCHILFSS